MDFYLNQIIDGMNIFSIIKDILKDKTGRLCEDIEFDKIFDVFLLSRYFSMRDDLLVYSSYINMYGNLLSKRNLYLFLIQYIPKKNNYFINYIKKKKKENENESK